MAEHGPELTPEGLPVVKEGILASLRRDIESGSICAGRSIARIMEDNHLVGEYISTLAEHLSEQETSQRPPSEEIIKRNTLHLCNIYELLRRQAESNQLEY